MEFPPRHVLVICNVLTLLLLIVVDLLLELITENLSSTALLFTGCTVKTNVLF